MLRDILAGEYLIVGLDVRDRPCLVVGGGAVAARRAAALVEAQATVTVVSPEVGVMPPRVVVERRGFHERDLDGMVLVVAATDDREVNARVAAAARERGIWANIADDPTSGSLVMPAVVRRGGLRIAVLTGNASPALARRLREKLEEEFGPEYEALTRLLDKLRVEWEPKALAAGVSQDRRAAAWEAVLDLPLLDDLRRERVAEAEAMARAVLEPFLSTDAAT